MTAADFEIDGEYKAGFKCVDVSSPRGRYQRDRNKSDFEFWMSQRPEDESDFESYASSLSAQLGLPLQRIRSLIACFQRLTMLPLLVALQRRMYHLDLDRLIAIDRALKGVSEENMRPVDEYLLLLLTPVVPNEVLRQPRAIANRINRKLTVIDPQAVRQRQQEKRGITITHEDLNTRVSLRVTPAEFLMLRKAISKKSKAEGISEIDAALKFFDDSTEAKIVLNLVPNEVGLLDLVGAGPLSQDQVEEWLPRVTHARVLHYNMAENADKRLFSPGSQAFLAGRDGHCMGLSCTTDALHCDGEHTVNFDGLNTDPGNGGKVCPSCHRIKTDKRLRMMSVNSKGVKVWKDSDGEEYVVLPDGPLAHTGELLTTPEEVARAADGESPIPNTDGWGQSIDQKIAKQRKDRRKNNLKVIKGEGDN